MLHIDFLIRNYFLMNDQDLNGLVSFGFGCAESFAPEAFVEPPMLLDEIIPLELLLLLPPASDAVFDEDEDKFEIAVCLVVCCSFIFFLLLVHVEQYQMNRGSLTLTLTRLGFKHSW